VLGLSPTLIRALIEHGDDLPKRHDLSKLRVLASTGEPWNPDPWRWLFDHVGGGRLPIVNYSGGTECSGGILSNTVIHPIKPCGFAAACPGIGADVYDEHGQPVRQAVGELVIRGPWIGQARGFWRDPARYEQTYWSRFPDTWVHGDWAEIDADGHWFIHGRSDDTLKIAGKRVGPAEVESVLVDHPDVREAAVIGVPDELKGSAMVAFCVTSAPSDALAAELRDRVAAEMGKPLRPERIHFVSAIPKTRNAKIMRRVVRAAYLGLDPGDLTALENPASVALIEALRHT
jgi:acetyl-CoA synthetase